ncbi:hypothetical protein ACKKBF_B01565 [Auxenochlorella protothecoides x Auxenochlorella symbiontica]
MQRVRVYHLNENGHWDDKGTGVIKVETAEHPTSDVHLIIEDDTDASRLLNHTVTQGTSYQRQKDDSIISWTEASSGIEIALSFQEAFTCTQVWAEIQSVQDAGLSPRAQAAKLQDRQWRTAGGTEAYDSVAAHHTYEESAGLMHGPHLPLGPGQSPAGQDSPPETGPFPAPGADLPAAELGNLPAIARSLSEASVFQRERLVHQLSAPGYLGRLVGLFRVCEDLEEEESLAQLHVALRAAIMLNDAGLIEALLSEPLVMDVVGALEYEPGAPDAAAGAADAGDAPTTSAHTLGLIVELLCYCVTQHSYRIKYYILRNNVVEKVLRLLHRKERWLVVAAIRFLRTCLGMKDEFYNRYLVKNGLLEPVIAVFLENGNRYNLLNSVVLELFEFMWRENMKGLLGYVVESPRWPELQALDFAPTFRRLSMKHDQNQERSTGSAAAPAGSGPGSEAGGGVFLGHARAAAAAQQRRIRGEKEEDEDEENYFKDDEDDDRGGSAAAAAVPEERALRDAPASVSPGPGSPRVVGASPPSNGLPPFPGRLVDYDDDDDDALPLGVVHRGGPGGRRGSSPPLQKRFRPASPSQ